MQLADGELPRISPDGQLVAYETPYRGLTRPALRVIPVTGGAVAAPAQSGLVQLAFSPDSRTIAAISGKEVGQKRLVLIDVASGKTRTVAHGQFSGFSFSPDGSTLVFARALKDSYPPRSDLLVVPVAGGLPAAPDEGPPLRRPRLGRAGDRVREAAQAGAPRRRLEAGHLRARSRSRRPCGASRPPRCRSC